MTSTSSKRIQSFWLALFDRERDNLRAVLRRALDRQDVETSLRLATSIWRYWYERGHFSEGRRWLEEILALAEEPLGKHAEALADESRAAADTALNEEALRRWAKALNEAATLAEMQGDYTAAAARYERSLAVRAQSATSAAQRPR